MGLLHGRTGRVTAENGVFWPPRAEGKVGLKRFSRRWFVLLALGGGAQAGEAGHCLLYFASRESSKPNGARYDAFGLVWH
jgi:hypothetical protein